VRKGNEQAGTPQLAGKIFPLLFLLWLLFVNLYYYAQFRNLAISRLPWLARLWR